MRRGTFVAAVVGVVAALTWPRAPSAPLPGALPWDKVVHLLLFGGLSVVGVWARVRTVPLGAVLIVTAVGTEVVQGLLLTERSGDVLDLTADLIGGAAGLTAALTVRAGLRKPVRPGD